jgi:hypothetical protein
MPVIEPPTSQAGLIQESVVIGDADFPCQAKQVSERLLSAALVPQPNTHHQGENYISFHSLLFW